MKKILLILSLFFLFLIPGVVFPSPASAQSCSSIPTPRILGRPFNVYCTDLAADTNYRLLYNSDPNCPPIPLGEEKKSDAWGEVLFVIGGDLIRSPTIYVNLYNTEPISWCDLWKDPNKPVAPELVLTAVPPPSPGPGYKPIYCDPPANTKIKTAIGCIPTSVPGFAGFFLKWFLGIAGVIAFFLILVAGFQILTSAGNPEKLEGAKQLLTAAVIGALFIVFAVVILQLFNVQIFGGLPGFPRFL